MDATVFVLSVITSVIGSVIVTLLVIGLVERNRRPALWVELEKPAHKFQVNSQDVELLRVKVHNKLISKWLSWGYSREPAAQCRAWLAFYDNNKLPVYSREMLGRWAETPNANIVEASEPNGKTVRFATNSEELRHSIDIASGANSILDVLVRFGDESDCYGWNNDSLIYYGKNPSWRLERGQYFVRVTVKTGGRDFDTYFRLINEMEFRLEPQHDLKLKDKQLLPENPTTSLIPTFPNKLSATSPTHQSFNSTNATNEFEKLETKELYEKARDAWYKDKDYQLCLTLSELVEQKWPDKSEVHDLIGKSAFRLGKLGCVDIST